MASLAGDTPNPLLSTLTRQVPPDRVTTAGPAYERARTVWNGAVSHSPAAVLHCREVSDVQAGVRVASELGIPLSVRGGGHGWTGAAVADGGLVLDLTGMRAVAVEADSAGAGFAVVQGGATSGDVAAAAHRHGLVAVTGTVDAVGYAGLSLGGGYGPLSGRFGLAVDNILGADVVLADGTRHTVDAENEPELFWALRGGGGNLGVVTGLRVALHSVPSVLSGMVLYPWGQAATVLSQLDGFLLHGPDELTVQAGFLTGPSGEPAVFLLPTWCGEPGDGERAFEPLARLGDPLLAGFGPASIPEMLAQNGAMFPDGRHTEIRPRNLPSLSGEAVRVLVGAGDTVASPLSAVSLHSLHGAATRVPVGETAFSARMPHLLVENIAVWEADDPEPERHRAWVRNLSAALEPLALPGGYPNLLAADETGQIAHAYDPHLDRLLAVKRRVDPAGLFSATPLPSSAD